ncbi:MAG: hypothetical protein J07HX64_02447 [halophilic archaeon J07HX64]|nr:MAG: hypothetical protein J07HX64_02447 [halophilic archaeon J07HX64]
MESERVGVVDLAREDVDELERRLGVGVRQHRRE